MQRHFTLEYWLNDNAVFAGARAVTWTQTSPCGQALARTKDIEVRSDLGENGVGRGPINPGNGEQHHDAVLPGHEAMLDRAIKPLDTFW